MSCGLGIMVGKALGEPKAADLTADQIKGMYEVLQGILENKGYLKSEKPAHDEISDALNKYEKEHSGDLHGFFRRYIKAMF